MFSHPLTAVKNLCFHGPKTELPADWICDATPPPGSCTLGTKCTMHKLRKQYVIRPSWWIETSLKSSRLQREWEYMNSKINEHPPRQCDVSPGWVLWPSEVRGASEGAGDYGRSTLYSSSTLIALCEMIEWGKFMQSKPKMSLSR